MIFIGSANIASAQSETPVPTLTPTPSYMQGVPMSTGNTLLITKTVSYGDIAVVASVLFLVAVELVKGMVEIPKNWTRK